MLIKTNDAVLHVTTAEFCMHQSTNKSVMLVVTRQVLLIVNTLEDSIEKLFSLKDLVVVDNISDPTMFRIYCPSTPKQPVRKSSPVEQIEVSVSIIIFF